MKNNIRFFALLLMIVSLNSCIKNDGALIGTKIFAEFDATVLNSPLTGQLYPVLTRVPAYGAAVVAANPAITRASGTIKFRVNLVGAQQSADQILNVKVVASPALPINTAAAVAGTHFTVPATLTIPANSSFGELTITVLDTGVPSATPVVLVIELEGNSTVNPSANYKLLGVQINQS